MPCCLLTPFSSARNLSLLLPAALNSSRHPSCTCRSLSQTKSWSRHSLFTQSTNQSLYQDFATSRMATGASPLSWLMEIPYHTSSVSLVTGPGLTTAALNVSAVAVAERVTSVSIAPCAPSSAMGPESAHLTSVAAAAAIRRWTAPATIPPLEPAVVPFLG